MKRNYSLTLRTTKYTIKLNCRFQNQCKCFLNQLPAVTKRFRKNSLQCRLSIRDVNIALHRYINTHQKSINV